MYTTRHLKSANAYHLGILSENIISFLKQQYILNISKQLVRLFTGALKANCWVAKAYRIIYGSDEMLVNARRGKVLGKHFPFNIGITFFLKDIINNVSFLLSYVHIYATIWIVRCTLGVVISTNMHKPYIWQKIAFCRNCFAW